MEPVDLEDKCEGVGESQQDDQRDQEDTSLTVFLPALRCLPI